MNNKQNTSNLTMDKALITAAAKKALIAADSQYFSWTPEKQERFRATKSEEVETRIRRVLLDSLLGIKCSLETTNKMWNDVPLEELVPLNWACLLTDGIGKDFIYLNESMAEGTSLLDFPTLYEYDYDSYLFQEKALKSDSPGYEGEDYYAWRHQAWIRLLIDDSLLYGSIFSLSQYVVDEIGEAGNDLIDQLIPHDYVSGKDDGKPVKGGFLWDMELDAGGLEGQLDELRSRWYTYQRECRLELNKRFSQREPAAYTVDKNWDGDLHRLFIFNNAEALKKVRWRHFTSDCGELLQDISTIKEELKQDVERALSWISENHQDIMTNFDPNVVRLKKERKVVLAPGVLDDLNRMASEDNETE